MSMTDLKSSSTLSSVSLPGSSINHTELHESSHFMEETLFLATSPPHAFDCLTLKVSNMRSTGWFWREVSLFACWRECVANKNVANNDWPKQSCNACKLQLLQSCYACQGKKVPRDCRNKNCNNSHFSQSFFAASAVATSVNCNFVKVQCLKNIDYPYYIYRHS
jgi:hypothetical protein